MGTGIALHREEDAAREDIRRLFVRKGTTEIPSREEMIAEYRRVAGINRTEGNLHTAFHNPSPMEIPLIFMRPSLRRKMLEFWDGRGNHPNLPDFASLPVQAQIALMSYNYGRRLSAAPRMCAAVKAGDYTLAAREAHVSGWDPRKNDAHKRLLLNAGIIMRDGLDKSQLPPLGRFKPPPMVTGSVESDLSWLLGWWTVWDGSYYYYYFGPNGFVQYVKTEPASSAPPPLVASLARPGGNATGFTAFEYGISGKWPELLKEIAPRVTRVAVLRDPALAAGIGQFAAIQSMASSSGVELSAIDTRDVGEIERAIVAFARKPNGGLVVTASASALIHRDQIIALATRLRLPNIYPFRYYPSNGGLASYGPDTIDLFRRAAGYVDRILKGEKPADLPVQAPTKYELVINLKTARALGLDVPPALLARADEVIE